MVVWAHAVLSVLPETRVLRAQRVLRAPLEVLDPKAIQVSLVLRAPPAQRVHEAQRAPAQILVTRVLPASTAHPVLAVPMARSVIRAAKAPPVVLVLREDAAKPAQVVIRAVKAQRAPLVLWEEPVKQDLPETPAPTVILAKPDYKDCSVPRVHLATLVIPVLRVLLAALVLRVQEAPRVIRVSPAQLAQPVVLVPEDQEVIQAIPVHKVTLAQRARQVLRGLAVQSA